ncbi:ABC transporter ATP-binding protein [Clostridia bacterium]|nr:ABC transporter ATP-binding protein [Clostridia bacterium]
MDNYEEYQYPKSFSYKTWAKIFPFVKPLGNQIGAAMGFMLFNAIIDVAYPLMIKYMVDKFLEPQQSQGLGLFAAIIAVLVTLQAFSTFMFIRIACRCEYTLKREMRAAVFRHLQVLPISYYNQTPVGYIMARAMSDTSNIGDVFVWSLVDMSWQIGYLIMAITAMFILNWKLALIVLGFVLALSFVTMWFQKRILDLNRVVRRRNSVMTGAMNEGIVGARTTKTLVLEDLNHGEFKGITTEMYGLNKRAALLRGIYWPLVFMFGSLAVCAVLVAGGWLSLEQGLMLGTLAAFLNFAAEMVHPLIGLAQNIPEFVSTQANVERVTAMLERKPEIIERPEVLERYGDNFAPKRENWEPLNGDVEFRDVTFMYPDGNVNVLEHFNLNVPRGSTIAIVGETGAGKSTLVNLVCRFFEPTGGQVLIDGRDIQDRTQLWLHSHLGYVLQTPHLFSGSVLENIRYGRLEATDEEVKAAAKIVSADTFIERLEKGWESDVGEGGDRLSTGQKQLVSLARAVLADPRIFVLDEATSSIDTETELLIQHAISVLLENRTSFVIAHRLSTIRGADMILVVEDGKIIERGTHDELMAAKGHYFDLYTKQFVDEAAK